MDWLLILIYKIGFYPAFILLWLIQKLRFPKSWVEEFETGNDSSLAAHTIFSLFFGVVIVILIGGIITLALVV